MNRQKNRRGARSSLNGRSNERPSRPIERPPTGARVQSLQLRNFHPTDSETPSQTGLFGPRRIIPRSAAPPPPPPPAPSSSHNVFGRLARTTANSSTSSLASWENFPSLNLPIRDPLYEDFFSSGDERFGLPYDPVAAAQAAADADIDDAEDDYDPDDIYGGAPVMRLTSDPSYSIEDEHFVQFHAAAVNGFSAFLEMERLQNEGLPEELRLRDSPSPEPTTWLPPPPPQRAAAQRAAAAAARVDAGDSIAPEDDLPVERRAPNTARSSASSRGSTRSTRALRQAAAARRRVAPIRPARPPPGAARRAAIKRALDFTSARADRGGARGRSVRLTPAEEPDHDSAVWVAHDRSDSVSVLRLPDPSDDPSDSDSSLDSAASGSSSSSDNDDDDDDDGGGYGDHDRQAHEADDLERQPFSGNEQGGGVGTESESGEGGDVHFDPFELYQYQQRFRPPYVPPEAVTEAVALLPILTTFYIEEQLQTRPLVADDWRQIGYEKPRPGPATGTFEGPLNDPMYVDLGRMTEDIYKLYATAQAVFLLHAHREPMFSALERVAGGGPLPAAHAFMLVFHAMAQLEGHPVWHEVREAGASSVERPWVFLMHLVAQATPAWLVAELFELMQLYCPDGLPAFTGDVNEFFAEFFARRAWRPWEPLPKL